MAQAVKIAAEPERCEAQTLPLLLLLLLLLWSSRPYCCCFFRLRFPSTSLPFSFFVGLGGGGAEEESA